MRIVSPKFRIRRVNIRAEFLRIAAVQVSNRGGQHDTVAGCESDLEQELSQRESPSLGRGVGWGWGCCYRCRLRLWHPLEKSVPRTHFLQQPSHSNREEQPPRQGKWALHPA